MPAWVLDLIIAAGLGGLGGGIRVLIIGRFVRPYREPDGKALNLGSISTILGGAAAGALLWYLTFADQGLERKTAVATILAGAAGTEVLLNLIARVHGVVTDREADQQTADIAGPQARSIETLSQDLARCNEREQELREQIERLKKGGAQ